MQNQIHCTTKFLHSSFLEDANPEDLKQIIEYLDLVSSPIGGPLAAKS